MTALDRGASEERPEGASVFVQDLAHVPEQLGLAEGGHLMSTTARQRMGFESVARQ